MTPGTAQLLDLDRRLEDAYNRVCAAKLRSQELTAAPGRDARAYEAGYLAAALADVQHELGHAIRAVRTILTNNPTQKGPLP